MWDRLFRLLGRKYLWAKSSEWNGHVLRTGFDPRLVIRQTSLTGEGFQAWPGKRCSGGPSGHYCQPEGVWRRSERMSEWEVSSNESCLGGNMRWRCFMSWLSDGKWTGGGAIVQVPVQGCKSFIQWLIRLVSWGQSFYRILFRLLKSWSSLDLWLNLLCAHSRV